MSRVVQPLKEGQLYPNGISYGHSHPNFYRLVFRFNDVVWKLKLKTSAPRQFYSLFHIGHLCDDLFACPKCYPTRCQTCGKTILTTKGEMVYKLPPNLVCESCFNRFR